MICLLLFAIGSICLKACRIRRRLWGRKGARFVESFPGRALVPPVSVLASLWESMNHHFMPRAWMHSRTVYIAPHAHVITAADL